jgi:hypothetical protein
LLVGETVLPRRTPFRCSCGVQVETNLSRKMSEKLLTYWNSIRSERAFPWRVFTIALVLRLIPVLLAYNLSIGLDDMFQYDMLGRSIVGGHGFRWYAQPDLDLIQQYVTLDLGSIHYDPRGIETAFRAPLYPAFLALVYFFSGTGPQRFFCGPAGAGCAGCLAGAIDVFPGAPFAP